MVEEVAEVGAVEVEVEAALLAPALEAAEQVELEEAAFLWPIALPWCLERPTPSP